MTAKPGNWANERSRRNFYAAVLFLTPNFVGFVAFVAVPVIFSLVMAFTNWDLTHRQPFAFVGFDNFKSLLCGHHSLEFYKYLTNTIYFMMGMPISIAGSLILAVLLNKPVRIVRHRRHRRPAVGVCLFVGMAVAGTLWTAGHRDAGFWVVVFTVVAALGAYLGTVFFRTLFYLPHVTAGVAMFILWKNLYNPQFGLINTALRQLLSVVTLTADLPPWIPRTVAIVPIVSVGLLTFRKHRRTGALLLVIPAAALAWGLWCLPSLAGEHLEPPNWLLSVSNLWAMDPEHVIPTGSFFGLGARDAIIFMGVWTAIGGANMLLYLAALANVPDELYEAAQIDGAGRWATFWNVTWPQLAPTTFLIVVISTIAAIQGGFEQARVMTAGGPAGTTTTLSYYIYTVGFEQFRLGLASAVCWVMFAIVFAVTLVNWRFGNRYVTA